MTRAWSQDEAEHDEQMPRVRTGFNSLNQRRCHAERQPLSYNALVHGQFGKNHGEHGL